MADAAGLRCVLACAATTLCALLQALSAPSALALTSRFGGEGEAAGQVSSPVGIAAQQQDGGVYLSDSGNARAERWTGEGVFLSAWGWGVSDGLTNAFQVCEATCAAGLTGAGAGQFGERPAGIAVDSSLGVSHGDVYVADPQNFRVLQFSAAGEFLLMFGGEVNETKDNTPGATEAEKDVCTAASGDVCRTGVAGGGAGAFAGLEGSPLAVDSSGTVYVGDRDRVQRFNASGVVQGQVGLSGAGFVNALVLDSVKDLYVVGSELPPGVHKFNPAGVELGVPRDGGEGASRRIAVGPADELFVYDEQRRILEFSAAGVELLSLDEQEQFGGGIAFGDAAQALYVLHQGGVRVRTLPPAGPVVQEGGGSVDELSPTSGRVHAVVNPEGLSAAEYHFQFGTSVSYGESTAGTPLPLDEVQSLTLAATAGTFTLSFQGEPTGPVAFDASAGELQSALEAVAAVGSGNVSVSGASGGPYAIRFTGALAATDVAELVADATGLVNGEEPGAATVATVSLGHGPFEDRQAGADLTGLAPSTTYHYRVVVTNAASQTAFGPDQTFTTLPAVGIEGESASQVTATSAKLQTELNPHGVATDYHFEYGPTTAYEQGNVPVPNGNAGSGTGSSAFSVLVEGLTPATTYHYRVIAHNALGTVQGEDRTFTTQAPEARGLLDGRVWELVSPADKHGVSLEALAYEGGAIQAAEDGSGLAYIAKAPVNGEPAGNRSISYSQLLAKRDQPGSWSTQDITTPHEQVTGLTTSDLAEYKLFAGDLSAGFVEPFGTTPLSPLASERTPYRRGSASNRYVPLAYPGNVPAGTQFGGVEESPGLFAGGVQLVTATPDGTRAILSSPSALTPGLVTAGNAGLYEWSAGALQLVSILPDKVPAAEEGAAALLGNENLQVRGAVSTDGGRVVFEANPGGAGNHLFLRDLGREETVLLDAPAPGARGGAGSPVFQLASSDGTRVLFKDEARLTVGAAARSGVPDLYECTIVSVAGHLSCALRDLSVPVNPGESGGVLGAAIGSDSSGRFVYFAANGVLSAGAAHGECGSGNNSIQESPAASCDLYMADAVTGTVRLVAVVSARDVADWDGEHGGTNLGSLSGRVSDNGRWFAFMSERPLTGFDNRDAVSGQPAVEAYLYDRETGGLTCVSCAPSGARPRGVFEKNEFPGLLVDRPQLWAGQWLAGLIPGWTRVDLHHALYQSRFLSDEGRLFFDSPVGLVPGDANGKMDVYEFEPNGVGGCGRPTGCVALVSSGDSAEESAFLDASASGNDVFMLTAGKLVAQDTDNSLDVYDAHVCTGAVPCAGAPASVPGACVTADACRAAPAPQPALFGAPASAMFSGPGNLTPVKPVVKPLTRAQILAKALAACKHKPKHKQPACHKQAKQHYGPKKHTAKHTNNNSRRGG